MQIISSERIQPAADIVEVIRRVGLTPSETKALEKIRRRIGDAADIADRFTGLDTAGRQGRKSPLEADLHDRIADFVADPSPGSAEAVAHAVVTLNAAPDIERNLTSAIEQIEHAAHGEANDILDGLFQRAGKVMKEELDTAQKALDASPALAGQARAFREQVTVAMQRAVDLREEARNSPLRFLQWELGF